MVWRLLHSDHLNKENEPFSLPITSLRHAANKSSISSHFCSWTTFFWWNQAQKAWSTCTEDSKDSAHMHWCPSWEEWRRKSLHDLLNKTLLTHSTGLRDSFALTSIKGVAPSKPAVACWMWDTVMDQGTSGSHVSSMEECSSRGFLIACSATKNVVDSRFFFTNSC